MRENVYRYSNTRITPTLYLFFGKKSFESLLSIVVLGNVDSLELHCSGMLFVVICALLKR